jgi:hypothetical protein
MMNGRMGGSDGNQEGRMLCKISSSLLADISAREWAVFSTAEKDAISGKNEVISGMLA